MQSFAKEIQISQRIPFAVPQFNLFFFQDNYTSKIIIVYINVESHCNSNLPQINYVISVVFGRVDWSLT
jgi:hypothetical protein